MIMSLLLSFGDVLMGMVVLGFYANPGVTVIVSIICILQIWLVWFSIGVIGNAGDRDVTRLGFGMRLVSLRMTFSTSRSC